MNNESLPATLILASGSKYRGELLRRLALPFEVHAPDVDESRYAGETPLEQVERLAADKARAVCAKYPEAFVIGSDQMAVFNGQPVGKPGNHTLAVQQLQSFSGRTVKFLTAVSVQCQASGFLRSHTDHTQVTFRRLQGTEIERYLEREQAYDCAGAFKAESLGITLFESIIGEDPTGLIGLPLIRTAAMLREAGFQLP